MDLVGPGPIEPHFEDSINAVSDIDVEGSWIDLGAGAGFPGIALATLHPGATVHLLESRHKRCVFLRRVVTESGLRNVKILQKRTENISTFFDGIISRAYKPPIEYLRDARRLCKPSGKVVLLTGDNDDFKPDEDWKLISKTRYPVGDGFRKRFLLAP